MCWQSECLSIQYTIHWLNADIQSPPPNYFQGRSCEVVDPSTGNIQSLPALSARWPKVYNVLFVCERRVYSNGHHVDIKVFQAFRGDTLSLKDYTFDTQPLYILGQVMYEMYNWDTPPGYVYAGGMRGYPADIDLAELCFWLPWQISSKWKLITLM